MTVQPLGDDNRAQGHDVEDDSELGPALRDARSIVERSTVDEDAADELRSRYQADAIEPLEPDATIAALLEPGESVFAVRESAIMNPGDPEHPHSLPGYGGTLYLTSRRLVHVGQVVLSVALSDIQEAVVIGQRLLLTLRNGEGMSLEIDRPRVFRVKVSAALQSART